MSSTLEIASDRRSYFRVHTELPLRLRGLSESEKEAYATAILGQKRGGASDLDPDIARWLDRLECKLDRIMLHLGLDGESVRPTERVPITLSGGGMLLPTALADLDDPYYLLEFELPGPPSKLVRSVAQRVKAPTGEHDIPVRFCTIHEQDREAIVRYTLEVERNSIRSRSTDGNRA